MLDGAQLSRGLDPLKQSQYAIYKVDVSLVALNQFAWNVWPLAFAASLEDVDIDLKFCVQKV